MVLVISNAGISMVEAFQIATDVVKMDTLVMCAVK